MGGIGKTRLAIEVATESVEDYADGVWLVDFALDRSNALAVRQVCVRLEGIPLALELAAARVKALSIEQIAARLDNELSLLTGGNRTAQSRQQTLRATLDWSYALLREPKRQLLRRLAVFVDYKESLAISRTNGEMLNIVSSLIAFAALIAASTLSLTAPVETATISIETEERERWAACLCGAAQSLREQIGALLPPHEQEEYDRLVALIRLVLGDDAFASSWEEGRALTWEQAVAAALEF